MFDHVAVIGLGLIGSSLVRDIRQHHLARHITGIDTNQKHRSFLYSNNLIDESHSSPEKAHRPCDLIILATPPGTEASIGAALAPLLQEGTIVMDTASVKQSVIHNLQPHLPETAVFVPAHPIAGSAESGPQAGQEGLFNKRHIILTPLANTPPQAIDLVSHFWSEIGGICEQMDPEKHDMIYAHMSHLPHIVAYLAADTLAPCHRNTTDKTLNEFLRLSGSDPSLWTAIIKHNKEQTFNAMENFLHILVHMITELESGQPEQQETTHSAPKNKVATQLFPRIIASCLASTAQLCEKRENTALLPYAGAGFASLCAPLHSPPEEDIEQISHAHQEVATMLRAFEQRLRSVFILMKQDDWPAVTAIFEQARQHSHQPALYKTTDYNHDGPSL